MLATRQKRNERPDRRGAGSSVDSDGHTRSGASRHPDGHKQVAELQRARMLTAMVQEVAERGAANVSVGQVVGRSGVSRRTFYEIFEDRDDCFLAAFDDALKRVAAEVIPAYRAAGKWREKVRAGLTILLESLDCDRPSGRLLIVESLAAGPKALQRRQAVLARIAPVIEEGSREGKADSDPAALTAEGILGGVMSVLHARLTEGSQDSLLELAGPLMRMIVLPYLGAAAARKELVQPNPQPSAKRSSARTDPFQGLPMRLTYRTMRVLVAVAELGGESVAPSNRAVGEHAGIGDQGQASKLLARLHKLGLIENKGGDPARGEPNAWALTQRGENVRATIAEQTTAHE